MIYQLLTMKLIPGKMAEYNEAAKEIQSIYPKVGLKMVGSFHAYTGDMNAIYTLYAFDDLAAYQKVRQTASKDAEYRRVSGKVTGLCVSQTYTLLEPNAWSPMK